ncbi:MAG: DNRLRE domain-containing protein [Nitrososphaerota archaeon]|nr:DNRLRE domain-containing protein [Nitrososphaerota archaeon]
METRRLISLLLLIATFSMIFKIQGGTEEILTVKKNFYPSDDAYVSSANPNDNYGGSEYIGIKVETMPPMTDIWRSYIKFNLESLPPGSSIVSATLWLYVYKPPSKLSHLDCWRVSQDWSETTIIWNKQPKVTEHVSFTYIKENVEHWISIEVKSSVVKFTSKDASEYVPNYGWRLNDQGENTPVMYTMFSKEAIFIPPTDYRPRLEVVYYPPRLELLLSDDSIEAGSWVKMSVYRKTVDGESITRGNLKVKLSSSSTSPRKKFALTPEGPVITELTIPDGADHKDFYYYDEKAGTWEIRVWTEQYSPYGDDRELITVNPGSLNRFVFNTISSPKIVMESFTITITAYDAYGNVKTDYTGTNSLSDTTGTIEPKMTGAFVNGKWTGEVIIKRIAKNVKITTRGAGKTGESNVFDVIAGPPAKLVIKPSSFTMNAGELYSYLNISLRDVNDFETAATSTITLSLSTSSPKGEFRDCITGGKITSLQIHAGLGWAKVCYNDTKHGTWMISASATGLTPGIATVTVIADTTPPVTTISIGSPKYYVGNTVYVNSSTSFSLSASDDASGVKEIKYRINDEPWRKYVGRFNLSGYADGVHEIGYYSIDNAANNEALKTITVILDNTPPSIGSCSPTGRQIQKSGQVTFTVTVEDLGSRVKEVRLIVDGIYQGLMTKRNNNYSKTINLGEGDHFWRIEAMDNLGNSVAKGYSLLLIIDDAPPVILGLSGPSAPAWGEPTVVSCQVYDEEVGVKEVILWYSIDGGASWSRTTMNLVGNRYSASIPSQLPFTKIKYYVEASDNIGNISQTNVFEYTIGIPTWIYVLVLLIALIIITVVIFSLRRKPKPSPPLRSSEPKTEEPITIAQQYSVEEVPSEFQEPVLPRLDYRSKIYEEIKLPFEEKKRTLHEETYEQLPEEGPSEEEMPSIFEEKEEEQEWPQQSEEDLEP